MVVDPCTVVVEAPVVVDVVVDGEDLATVKPVANPMPSAARTSMAMPTPTTVLRLIVTTRGSFFTTQGNGSPGCRQTRKLRLLRPSHHDRAHRHRGFPGEEAHCA